MTNHYKINFNTIRNHFYQFSAFLLLNCIVLSSQIKAVDTSNQWQLLTQPIYKSDQKKELLGNAWLVLIQQESAQLSFKLEISKNAQFGQWIGELRTTINIDGLDLSFVDNSNQKIKLHHERAIKRESFSVTQGDNLVKIHVFTFLIEWDGMAQLLNAQSIDIRYRTLDEPKVVSHKLISADGLKPKLEELSKTIKSNPETRFFVLTQSQLDSIAIGKLPAKFKKKVFRKIQIKLMGTGNKVKLSDEEVNKNSLVQVKNLINGRIKGLNTAKEKAHQAIYDLEPKWIDMNMCPASNVSHCHYVGRDGIEKQPLLSMEPYNYGKIRGVVWRSKNSIIKINGGNLSLGIEPEIVRASNAGYYYLFTNDAGRVDYVINVDSINAE